MLKSWGWGRVDEGVWDYNRLSMQKDSLSLSLALSLSHTYTHIHNVDARHGNRDWKQRRRHVLAARFLLEDRAGVDFCMVSKGKISARYITTYA